MFRNILNACVAEMVKILTSDPEEMEMLHSEIEACTENFTPINNFATSFIFRYFEMLYEVCNNYKDTDILPIIAETMDKEGFDKKERFNILMYSDNRLYWLVAAMTPHVTEAFADHLKFNFA